MIIKLPQRNYNLWRFMFVLYDTKKQKILKSKVANIEIIVKPPKNYYYDYDLYGEYYFTCLDTNIDNYNPWNMTDKNTRGVCCYSNNKGPQTIKELKQNNEKTPLDTLNYQI